jgi:hypothetical protein
LVTAYWDAGNFFSSALYRAPLPVCVVAACDDELNVNLVLPPLCCASLPWGPFVVVANNTVDLLVPQFLSAALADPACRADLFAKTQNTFSYLQTTTQKVSVNVYEQSGEDEQKKKKKRSERAFSLLKQFSLQGKFRTAWINACLTTLFKSICTSTLLAHLSVPQSSCK